MTERLDGAVAMVTGGVQRIGAAYARGMAAEGARVAITGQVAAGGGAVMHEDFFSYYSFGSY